MQRVQPDFVDSLAQLPIISAFSAKKLVYYFPFAFIGFLIALKFVSKKLYWYAMAMEDGPAEYLTALVYLVAAFVAFRIAVRLRKDQQPWGLVAIVGLFALGYFFIGMEEISWGQRIFGIETPEAIAAYNHQDEITIHNLLSRYPLHMAYIIIGLYGAYAWKFFPNKLKQRFSVASQFLIPSRILFWYFMPVTLLYLYYDYISVLLVQGFGWTMFEWQSGLQGWIISKDQEPIELLLSIGFLAFTCMLFNRQTHQRLKLVKS